MTDVIVDASVALKWFHAEGETQVEEARQLLGAQRTGQVRDLTFEIGNALVRRLGFGAVEAAAVLGAFDSLVGTVALEPRERRLTAELAEAERLTYYDAAYAAVARARGDPGQRRCRATWITHAGVLRRPSGGETTPGSVVRGSA